MDKVYLKDFMQHAETCTWGENTPYENSEDGYTEIPISETESAIQCNRCGAFKVEEK